MAEASKPVEIEWSDADQTRIRAYVEHWRGVLLMDRYQILVRFESVQPESDPHLAAEMETNHPYLSNWTVVCYPELLLRDANNQEEQSRKILHELSHVITAPLRNAAHDLVNEKLVLWRDIKDRDETLVDWIANVVFRLTRQGQPGVLP